MKKNLILKITIASGLSFFVVGGTISAVMHDRNFEQANAYSISSLPTTIDLNDSTASEIRNYYSALNGKSASELKGNNLLKNLKPILKNNQKYYSYDYSNGTSIWQIYEIADRDWAKSPASSTTYGTYNSNTNKITNYQYGTNSSNKNNPYLHALYVNRDVTNQTRAWGDHTQTGWGINREHVWAKSHGMGSDDDSSNSGGARGDPMHLLSGNGYVNGFNYHGNLFFGFVDKTKSYSDAGNDNSYTYLSGNLKGTSATFGSGSVFEPQDSDKGDIARIIFYMAARYNYLSGSDSDGIDANNPWLTVYDGTSDPNGTSTYDSNTSTQGYMGVLRDLLAWNRLDPPDEWEIHRNNLLFKNYTNNRNPFIDFPEWAEYIWGSSTLSNDNRKVTSYSSTSTGSANPTSDTINAFSGQGQTVAVTGVEVFPTAISLNVGDSNQLYADVLPSNASNKSVNWSSDNSSIVSVNNSGFVTAYSAGTTNVRATTVDGGYSATCAVTVNNGGGSTTEVQYELVTDGLSAGDQVVIGAQANWNATTMYALTKVIKSTYYLTPETGSVSNRILNKTDTMPVWTVGGSSGAYTFENDGDYLYGKKNGSYNNIYANGTSSTANKTWSVTLNNSGTGFDVCSPDGVYLEYYSNYTEFTGYSSSNNNCPINFYRKVEVDPYTASEFAQDFLNSITCDATGNTAPTLSRSWSQLAALYNEVESNEKVLLVNASANENGTVIERAMARYDFLCGKYNQFNNFIGRASANASNSAFLPFYQDRSLILAFSLSFSVVAIGIVVLITLKKKKVI